MNLEPRRQKSAARAECADEALFRKMVVEPPGEPRRDHSAAAFARMPGRMIELARRGDL